MGISLNFCRYKKSESYIINKIPSVGLYEVNYQIADEFRIGNTINCRGGLSLFNSVSHIKNIAGLKLSKRMMLFYYLADDFIDGTTITTLPDGNFSCIFCDPTNALYFFEAVVQNLQAFENIDLNFDEDEVALIRQCFEFMKKAKDEDCLIHLSWS